MNQCNMAINKLINKINELMTLYSEQKMCIIFDIDDTLISSIDNKIIKHTFAVYNYCVKIGLPIFIITARNALQSNIKYTQKELEKHNIINYNSIYFRPINNFDIFQYKYNCRKDIYDKGYFCIMSLGDQLTDIGEYGGFGVLITRR